MNEEVDLQLKQLLVHNLSSKFQRFHGERTWDICTHHCVGLVHTFTSQNRAGQNQLALQSPKKSI
jgi:hypothetical protein